jgi:hypothetical protein
MEAEIPTETMSLNEYAEFVNAHPRTVKRWLANGELPGAFRDPFSKEWRFTRDTTRQQKAAEDAAPQSFEVAVSGANGQMMVPPQWFPHPGEIHEDEPTRLEMLDEESAFLTVERAARFLGVPQAQIRANAEMFNLMPVGISGSLMVPKSTIRRFEGK